MNSYVRKYDLPFNCLKNLKGMFLIWTSYYSFIFLNKQTEKSLSFGSHFREKVFGIWFSFRVQQLTW